MLFNSSHKVAYVNLGTQSYAAVFPYSSRPLFFEDLCCKIKKTEKHIAYLSGALSSRNRGAKRFRARQISFKNQRALAWKRLSLLQSAKKGLLQRRIRSFWETEIAPRSISHGTHTIYQKHIQAYGFNQIKPLPRCMNRIIAFYERWQSEVFAPYLKQCVDRYHSEEVAVSFTMSPGVLQEFSTGVRRGGEFSFGFRRLVRQLKEKIDLTEEDQRDLVFTEEFLRIVDEFPAMVAKVNCGCSDLDSTPHFFGSFENFQRMFKSRSGEELVVEVDAIFDRIRSTWKRPDYGWSIFAAIKPENIEIEVLTRDVKPFSKEQQAKEELEKLGLPLFVFDQTYSLSHEEILKVMRFIVYSPFYKDANFMWTRHSDGTFTITFSRSNEQKERQMYRQEILSEIDNPKLYQLSGIES